MRFVSPALRRIVFPVLSHSGYLRRSIGAAPAVVTYHGVFPRGYRIQDPGLDGNLVCAESFRRQLQLLKQRYHVISPDEFLLWVQGKLSLHPRSVLLTCDDALQSTLTEMVPMLKELDLSCLFFATGASSEPTRSPLWYEELYLMLVDAALPFTLSLPEAQIEVSLSAAGDKHPFWWKLVKQLSRFDGLVRRDLLAKIRRQLKLAENWSESLLADASCAARFLTLDLAGLRQLGAAGMTVGAHSLSHPVLAEASQELAGQEIAGSRAVLEHALGKKIWAFAYPFGNAATVTRRDINLAEQAGFSCAFMNVGGGFGANSNRYAVPRVHVTAAMNLPEFEAHVSGFYRALREKLLGVGEAAVSA